ncbi:cupin domain-containing protein [Allonocardiopsis opalescens]|uniref:Cupin domain-containing protein n=1 Tax=Allonocardiopsis opalescens TaxID=1144618 RepID=A0A2T0PZD8_9ACTN|nr:cupin domain-containing protein [Allonocardiopsis opalescens]PRX96777.1 Cupin domain-containing protein [Allonocardiopsis opalescens]
MHIRPDDVPTMSFDWGTITWFVTPASVPGAATSQGEVIVYPGRGHERHNHPDAEELIYVVSGEAEQTVGDGEPFTIREGEGVWVPTGVYHSTHNRSWRPLRLVVTYSPGGAEAALTEAPDFRSDGAGMPVLWRREG